MAETATVFGPKVFPWSFYEHRKKIVLKYGVRNVELNNSHIKIKFIYRFQLEIYKKRVG